mmetsp:Transcript_9629/g.20523  ORF Transcript_9629/g.20523 Transcript_9629/m.20523 type:complete len:396 (-) Transcript_9629:68-1255(-)
MLHHPRHTCCCRHPLLPHRLPVVLLHHVLLVLRGRLLRQGLQLAEQGDRHLGLLGVRPALPHTAARALEVLRGLLLVVLVISGRSQPHTVVVVPLLTVVALQHGPALVVQLLTQAVQLGGVGQLVHVLVNLDWQIWSLLYQQPGLRHGGCSLRHFIVLTCMALEFLAARFAALLPRPACRHTGTEQGGERVLLHLHANALSLFQELSQGLEAGLGIGGEDGIHSCTPALLPQQLQRPGTLLACVHLQQGGHLDSGAQSPVGSQLAGGEGGRVARALQLPISLMALKHLVNDPLPLAVLCQHLPQLLLLCQADVQVKCLVQQLLQLLTLRAPRLAQPCYCLLQLQHVPGHCTAHRAAPLLESLGLPEADADTLGVVPLAAEVTLQHVVVSVVVLLA